jgi:hypothetical protein
MKLSDRWYNVLKWLVLVCFPALTTAYVGLDAIFKWGYADTVAKVSAIVCTLIGSLIGISTAEYNKVKKEE